MLSILKNSQIAKEVLRILAVAAMGILVVAAVSYASSLSTNLTVDGYATITGPINGVILSGGRVQTSGAIGGYGLIEARSMSGSEPPAIYGRNDYGFGVYGYSPAYYGVYGVTNSGTGVWGQAATTGTGISGTGGTYGVYGASATYGVYGRSTTSGGWGIYCAVTGDGYCGGQKAWSSVSDERLKTDISNITDALTKVMRLRGIDYTWKADPVGQRHIGFIAQEVLPFVPEVVGKDKDGYYNISLGEITPLLVEAIKEQQGEIDGLRAENDGLRARLDNLEAQISRLGR